MGSIASPIVAAQFYETPFIYAKTFQQSYLDSAPITGLTGDYPYAIKSDGDSDFFARRMLNVYNFNDMNGLSFMSAIGNQTAVTLPGLDYPLAPEKLYTLGADIPVLLAQNSGLFLPGVAFLTFPLGGDNARVAIASTMAQGVKRRNGRPNNIPNYTYYEKPFTYVLQFTQNWFYLKTPYASLIANDPRSFYIAVNDYDFELQAIEFSADYNNTTENSYNGYMCKLYDANGYALMSDWVHYRYLSYNGGYSGGGSAPGNTEPWFPNCFPVPPVLYTKGSNIKFDVLSLLDTVTGGGGNSITQYVNFRGVRRLPC